MGLAVDAADRKRWLSCRTVLAVVGQPRHPAGWFLTRARSPIFAVCTLLYHPSLRSVVSGAFVALVCLEGFWGVGSWCREARGQVVPADDKTAPIVHLKGDWNQSNNGTVGSGAEFARESARESAVGAADGTASESVADSAETSDSTVSSDAAESAETMGDANRLDARGGASLRGVSDESREAGAKRTSRAVRVAGRSGARPSNQSGPRGAAHLVPASRTYIHGFFTVSVGDSFRFNNPFRLSYQLGETGKSVSVTPLYLNLGAAGALGNPDGFQHGVSLQWSRQLWGLPQNVVTPTYLLLYGGWRPWLGFARAGVAVVLNPDSSAGAEVAVGAAYMLTGGIGLQAELVGNLFYGAATWDKSITTIPMLSMQVGVIVDLERLP